jgi:hypothetical protein
MLTEVPRGLSWYLKADTGILFGLVHENRILKFIHLVLFSPDIIVIRE